MAKPGSRETALDAPESGWEMPAAERRQLTVQFCDLVGSTELSTRLDPEDLREIVSAYHRCVANTVARFDGYVAKYMGDGVLVYFGYPLAHEDDAERAVRAGLALADTVGQIAAPERLRVRVGIATGPVVVGDLIGSGEAKERRVIGETPNLAARLQALAQPGDVVIAQSTRRLVGDLFEYRDLGAVEIKGFAASVSASQVLRGGATESRFEAVRSTETLTPLVGRKVELAILLDRWQRAKHGEGQVVLISAEPGIGKSRLIASLVNERLQAEPSYIRLRYFCSLHHTASALYPIVAQLERAAGITRNDASDIKLDKLEAVLARTSPPVEDVALLADLLSVPASDRYPSLNFTPQRKREKTLEALIAQLIALARQQPVLMIFEDVHWIDPSSRELLDLIVEQVPRQRLLLVMSFRPEFKPPSWADQAHVTTLVLPRLDRDEGTAIIEQIAGDKRLPSEIMDQILAKTDGVPLFVEELTKMILESGLLEDLGDRYALVGSLPLAIPTTLQDSLMARLDRLGRAKEVAQVGAAIGQAFSYNLLAAVAPLRGTELQKALDQLGNAGLVLRREGSQQASYAFKHALVQDAAYQSLLHSTRRQLHARIAGVIEERFPETTELEPELLAHQCTQASLVDKAVSYRLKSGMRAIERSGAVEAVAQLEKGLDLMPSLPSGPERDRQELGLQAAMAAVLVGARGYAAPETNKTLLRARELCERTRDRARTLSVLFLQSALHIVRAEFHAVRNLGEEMQRLGQEWDDSAARLMGGHQLGVGLFSLGEFALARAQFEEVLALYDPEQHRPLTFLYAQNPQVTALCFLSCILFPLGYPEQALRRREEALAHSAELTHFNTTAFALVWACVLDQLRRDRQAVRERSESLISLCTEQRLFFWLATGHMFHGWALADGGEPAAGIAELRQGLAAWRAIGSEYFLPKLIEMQVEAQYRAGEPAGPALDLLSDALSVADKTGEGWLVPELHRLRGNFLLSLSVPDGIAAEASFQQALETARAQGTKMWELRAATCLAQLWRDQGRKADAYDLLAPVYAWFNEGFDTPDLKEAKAILGELRA
ncbi:MAG TPA: adenylate/guanylate cyclase domain-containing protein [Aestuariivirgaceae bacterium]